MTYFTFAAMLLLAASAVFSLYRQLKILQHNDYSLIKYFKWLYNSYFVELAVSAIIYCATMFCILNDIDIVALVLAVLLLVARVALNILTHKKSEKKLAFTTRVKCLYIAAIVVLGVLLFVSVISFGNVTKLIPLGDNYLVDNNMMGEMVRTFCILLSTVTPSLTIIIWLITYPIEKLISKRHGNNAEGITDTAEKNSESATDLQEETEKQSETSDYTYESMLKDYDDGKGAES